MNVVDQKSSFIMVFGSSPIVKVLDFFLEHREFDYSLTEIARNADIGWSTLHQFWKDIVALGIVVSTRRIGRAELYKLNTENSIVKKLIEVDFEVSKNLLAQEQEGIIA